MQEETRKQYIHEIKKQLRLAMNGVASTSMRKRGLEYALNFGVSIPRLKQIAAGFPKEQELADYCWQSGSREMKILSALLQNPETCTPEITDTRIREMPNLEIARQYSRYVFPYLPFIEEKLAGWLSASDELTRATAYLVLLRLFGDNHPLSQETEKRFLSTAAKDLYSDSFSLKKALSDCLKRYGRRNSAYAETVLTLLRDFKDADDKEKKELYEDIKFDLEFYLGE